MVTAVETRPGTDPDRASFTTALEAARDQLTAARGICPAGPADLTGAIGRAVLATLLPARRLRYSARKVKCATSRYLNRDDGRPATPPPSPRSTSRSTPRPSTSSPAGPTATARPAPPAPPDHPPAARHRHHDQRTPPRLARPRTRRTPRRSRPATCSPSSANGPGSASSPAPASVPTRSTRRPPTHPRQPRQTLNFAGRPIDGLHVQVLIHGSHHDAGWVFGEF